MTAEIDTFQSDQLPNTRMLYSREEAARQLSLSLRSIAYLISTRQLETRKIGRRRLIPHGEVVRYRKGDHLRIRPE